MVSSKELRTRAWNKLKNGGYWMNFAASVLGGIVSGVFPIVTYGPMVVGVAGYYSKYQRGEEAKLEDIFQGFSSNNFVVNLLAGFLQMLFSALWSILFIVPGLIYSCATAVFSFVRYDHPEYEAYESLTKTKELMNGYKWKYFCLILSFIGWYLLCVLTCGIGFLFLAPYIDATTAEFYAELKKEHGEPINEEVSADDEPKTEEVFDA